MSLDLRVGFFGVGQERVMVRMCVCRGSGGRMRCCVGQVKVPDSDGERNT